MWLLNSLKLLCKDKFQATSKNFNKQDNYLTIVSLFFFHFKSMISIFFKLDKIVSLSEIFSIQGTCILPKLIRRPFLSYFFKKVVCFSHQLDRHIKVCITSYPSDHLTRVCISHQSDRFTKVCISRQSDCRIRVFLVPIRSPHKGMYLASIRLSH